MTKPCVSIFLPTLNSRAFLGERLATVMAQTLPDWELIVSDSYSDDGGWEIIQAASKADPRIRAEQAPRDGIYENINRCLERARGDYVYVATSDDTMAPDCIGKLVTALKGNPSCGIAQCCLNAIDESGKVIPDWWRLTGLARFIGDDYLRPHVRLAPYDGVLHCAMHTQYHSMTQILIRRSVFAATGPFPTQFGPGGDFCWGMKAGLLFDVVHVPEFLATWRVHAAQASAGYRETASERLLMVRMVDEALAARPSGSPAALLPAGAMRFPYRFEHYRLSYAEAHSRAGRIAVLLRMAIHDPSVALRALGLRISGQRRGLDKAGYVRALLRKYALEGHFVLKVGK